MSNIWRRKLRCIVLAITLLMPFLLGMSLPGELARLVEAGNRHYSRGEFKSAGEKYDKAVKIDPESTEAAFNAAAARYRLEDYEGALKGFSQAAESAGGELTRFAHYNAGNAAFRLGRLDEAIESYKKALTLDPTDEQARHNLEFAQRRQQQEQRGAGGKQDQKDRQKQQKKPRQKEESDNKQQQDQQSPKQDPQGEDPDQPQDPGQQDQDKPKDSQNKDEKGQNKPDQSQQGEARPMNKEQADQLLRALAQEDANVQKIIRRAPMTQPAPTDKDW